MAEKVRNSVMANWLITIRKIKNDLSIAYGSIQGISTEELGMHGMDVKFLPKILAREQQDLRFDVAMDML